MLNVISSNIHKLSVQSSNFASKPRHKNTDFRPQIFHHIYFRPEDKSLPSREFMIRSQLKSPTLKRDVDGVYMFDIEVS